MALTRHSNIGRDNIRNTDRNPERPSDSATVVTRPEPGTLKPVLNEDSITPLKLSPVIAPKEDVSAEPGVPHDTGADCHEAEIESFETHRVDEANATVDILVKWANGKQTWEPEWSLQQQVPLLVYKYWDSLDGRDAATGLDVYHVFRVLKRAAPPRTKECRYQVQWVGYRRSESTWEYDSKVAQIAPEELVKFQSRKDSAVDVPAKKSKREMTRGSRRTRKKVQID